MWRSGRKNICPGSGTASCRRTGLHLPALPSTHLSRGSGARENDGAPTACCDPACSGGSHYRFHCWGWNMGRRADMARSGRGWGVSLTEAGMALCDQHRLSQWEPGNDATVVASARFRVAAPQQAEQIPKKADPRSGERGGHQRSGAAPPEEAADGGPRAEGEYLAGTQVT